MVFTKNKRGEGYIEICILVIVFCIILSVMISFVTTVQLIKQTKRNSRVVLDSFVMNNSVEFYDSIKQGNDKIDVLDAEKYLSEFCSFCSLQKGTDCLTFVDENGNKIYEISTLKMEFDDPNRMKIKISYTIKLPVSFASMEVTEVYVPVTVISNYNKKF